MSNEVSLELFTPSLDSNKKIMDLIKKDQNLSDAIKEQSEDMCDKAVNVETTMQDLVAAGKLLEIADLGSNGFHVNVAVKTMMAGYQSLVHDSTTTLFEFRDNCKSAIENVVTAIDIFNADEYTTCIEILGENKAIAEKMATQSDLLAGKSEELWAGAKTALNEATEQDVVNKDLQAKLKEQMAQADVMRKQCEAEEKYNKIEIDRLQKATDEAWERADRQASREHSEAIVKSIFGGVTEVAKVVGTALPMVAAMKGMNAATQVATQTMTAIQPGKPIDKPKIAEVVQKNGANGKDVLKAMQTLVNKKVTDNQKTMTNEEKDYFKEAQEHLNQQILNFKPPAPAPADGAAPEGSSAGAFAKAAQEQSRMLNEMKKKNIENKAKLQKLLAEIENKKDEEADIETVIDMITMLMQVLGQIITTFRNLQTFWEMEASYCHKLAALSGKGQKNIERVIKFKGKDAFKKLVTRNLRESGIKWCVLFKVNHEGFESIQEAKTKIDSIMCNLGQMDEEGRALSKKQILAKMHEKFAAVKEVFAANALPAIKAEE
jgi:hypothetical protein